MSLVPAVPMPASRSLIRADSDRFRSGRNNPVFFILKGDTQDVNTLLITEIEEEPN